MTKLFRMIGFIGEFRRFGKMHREARPELPMDWSDRWPRLRDRTTHLPFDAHYVYHTAWAARMLADIRPAKHIDVSSYTFFSTVASAFVPIEFYDYRPANIKLSNLVCGAADLCKLPWPDGSVESISCMHTIEHIGLGRYGDPFDAAGDKRALAELERVVAPGGSLLIVVPVGKPRVQFNAHRIYDPKMIEAALPRMKHIRSAILPDRWEDGLVDNPTHEFALQQRYACGCFRFEKPRT
ncbi:MAG: DUF268 domain-containing protein [Pirellulales bacterium]